MSFESLPICDPHKTYYQNFPRFFKWALELDNPSEEIPQAAESNGFNIKNHPLGFKVCYLSHEYEGVRTPEVMGVVRANVYSEDTPLEPDIHAHGFNSVSGIVQGTLISYFYDVDSWLEHGTKTDDGEGYTGYLNSIDAYGKNRSQLLTQSNISLPLPRRVVIARRGKQYTQVARDEFHRVQARGSTVTIFAKSTPMFDTQESRGIVFRPPGHIPPPELY